MKKIMAIIAGVLKGDILFAITSPKTSSANFGGN